MEMKENSGLDEAVGHSDGKEESQTTKASLSTREVHVTNDRHSLKESMSIDEQKNHPGVESESTSLERDGSTESSLEQSGSDDSATRSKVKKDRSLLRKGKWTVEEEEYTSRIIHYFSMGLLTLPEGATLRSYLADKLNCDPMRVTKKYAGASCLGRRVYHFRDRPQPTIQDIQYAKAELDFLEQRFHRRLEEGPSGSPLPSRPCFLSDSNQINSLLAQCTPQSSNAMAFPGLPALGTSLAQAFLAAPLQSHWISPGVTSGSNPWLISNRSFSQSVSQNNAQSSSTPAPGVFSNFGTAPKATTSRVNTSQPNVPNFQQQQVNASSMLEKHLRDLQKTYENHLKSVAAQSVNSTISPSSPVDGPPTTVNPDRIGESRPSSEEDQLAANILVGVLGKLRKSYEDAVNDQSKKFGKGHAAPATVEGVEVPPTLPARRPAPVTDTSSGGSSQHPESSIEDSDWNSDKKTDPSSSEDSDKDIGLRYRSKGPPRKRLKTKKLEDERNAAIHRGHSF